MVEGADKGLCILSVTQIHKVAVPLLQAGQLPLRIAAFSLAQHFFALMLYFRGAVQCRLWSARYKSGKEAHAGIRKGRPDRGIRYFLHIICSLSPSVTVCKVGCFYLVLASSAWAAHLRIIPARSFPAMQDAAVTRERGLFIAEE